MKSLSAIIITTICAILINGAVSKRNPSAYIPYEYRGLPVEFVYGHPYEDRFSSFKRDQEVGEVIRHDRKLNKQNERAVKEIHQPLCNEERVTLRIGANDHVYDYKPKTINLVKCINAQRSDPQKFECGAEHCVNTNVDIDLFRSNKSQTPPCWEFVTKLPVSVACECQALVAEYHPRPKKPYPSNRDISLPEDFF